MLKPPLLFIYLFMVHCAARIGSASVSCLKIDIAEEIGSRFISWYNISALINVYMLSFEGHLRHYCEVSCECTLIYMQHGRY